MGMGASLSLDGFFERAGRIAVARAKTKRRLVGVLVWGSGLVAAVVTNDAVCALLAPLVVGWMGSVATLVGNPQNTLCGSLGRLQFAPFLLHLLPVAIVNLTLLGSVANVIVVVLRL